MRSQRRWREVACSHPSTPEPALCRTGARRDLEFDFPALEGVRTFYLRLAPERGPDGAVAHVLGVSTDITARKQAEGRALTAERARADPAEHITSEIAHRVKNNLAMITGLLHVQLLREADAHTAAVLRDAISRIRTFATVHDQIYASRREGADLVAAIRELGATLTGLFSPGAPLDITVEGDSLSCDARFATNLSVITNELITNALKHGGAGPDGRRAVKVRLGRTDEAVTLSVWNSGPPVSGGVELARSETLGLMLGHDMAQRNGGQFRLAACEGGTRAEVVVPAEAMEDDSAPR